MRKIDNLLVGDLLFAVVLLLDPDSLRTLLSTMTATSPSASSSSLGEHPLRNFNKSCEIKTLWKTPTSGRTGQTFHLLFRPSGASLWHQSATRDDVSVRQRVSSGEESAASVTDRWRTYPPTKCPAPSKEPAVEMGSLRFSCTYQRLGYLLRPRMSSSTRSRSRVEIGGSLIAENPGKSSRFDGEAFELGNVLFEQV